MTALAVSKLPTDVYNRPDTVYYYDAWRVYPSGVLGGNNNDLGVDYSYGSPYASFGGVNRSIHAFVTWIDGYVGYISNTVFDGSYGHLAR